MPLRTLLRILLNNEQIVQKLSESYPIRRAAQLTAYFMQKGNEKMEEIKESDMLNKFQDDVQKTGQKLEQRASNFTSSFGSELKKEWEKEKLRIEAEKKKDNER